MFKDIILLNPQLASPQFLEAKRKQELLKSQQKNQPNEATEKLAPGFESLISILMLAGSYLYLKK